MYDSDTGNSGKIFKLNIKGNKTMKAIWNGKVLAESNETVEVEGNHYFPKESIACEYFEETFGHKF